MKKSRKKLILILALIAVVIAIVGIVIYLQNEKYATDITAKELAVIEDYMNIDKSSDYEGKGKDFAELTTVHILGEKQINSKITNYYAVIYDNSCIIEDRKVIKGKPYSEMSGNELREVIRQDEYSLIIFKTEGRGADLKVISTDQGISSEGGERSPEATNFMLFKASHFKISDKELKEMDERNEKRLKKLNCTWAYK